MLASGSVACRSLSGHGAHRSSLPGTFPPSLHDGTLSLPVEDQAFCYFATRYSLAPTQFLDPGYLPVLRLISGRKYMGQCLSCALSAVSLAAFSTRPNSRRTRFRALKVYSTALRLINEEVQRPGSCEDDELVAAVLLLALFEVQSSPWLPENDEILTVIFPDLYVRERSRMGQSRLRCSRNDRRSQYGFFSEQVQKGIAPSNRQRNGKYALPTAQCPLLLT